jgi:hypothetical protein
LDFFPLDVQVERNRRKLPPGVCAAGQGGWFWGVWVLWVVGVGRVFRSVRGILLSRGGASLEFGGVLGVPEDGRLS